MNVDVLTVGEAMAAFRSDSMIRLGGSLSLSVVGAESNVAIGLARLGHRVRWVGRVGGDELGALVLRTLRAEGVDVTCVEVCAGETTGMALFDTAPGGARRVHYRRSTSAARGLAPDHVVDAVRRGTRILHVTGITPALGPLPRAAVSAAVAAAGELGVMVSLDVNFRAKLWTASDAADALRPLLPHVSVLIASESEVSLVAKARDEEAQVKELLELGIDEVVVKRGARGADCYSSVERHTAPAVRVPVVDPVGAGDAFTAGYLSGLIDELPAVRPAAARSGARCRRSSVARRLGGTPATVRTGPDRGRRGPSDRAPA